MPEGYRHLTHGERCRIGARTDATRVGGGVALPLKPGYSPSRRDQNRPGTGSSAPRGPRTPPSGHLRGEGSAIAAQMVRCCTSDWK